MIIDFATLERLGIPYDVVNNEELSTVKVYGESIGIKVLEHISLNDDIQYFIDTIEDTKIKADGLLSRIEWWTEMYNGFINKDLDPRIIKCTTVYVPEVLYRGIFADREKLSSHEEYTSWTPVEEIAGEFAYANEFEESILEREPNATPLMFQVKGVNAISFNLLMTSLLFKYIVDEEDEKIEKIKYFLTKFAHEREYFYPFNLEEVTMPPASL